jgi:hypothetical protein
MAANQEQADYHLIGLFTRYSSKYDITRLHWHSQLLSYHSRLDCSRRNSVRVLPNPPYRATNHT